MLWNAVPKLTARDVRQAINAIRDANPQIDTDDLYEQASGQLVATSEDADRFDRFFISEEGLGE